MASVQIGHQSSILGPWLIYINHLPGGLESSVKLFADDTLQILFSTVYDPNMSTDQFEIWKKVQNGPKNEKVLV